MRYALYARAMEMLLLVPLIILTSTPLVYALSSSIWLQRTKADGRGRVLTRGVIASEEQLGWGLNQDPRDDTKSPVGMCRYTTHAARGKTSDL